MTDDRILIDSHGRVLRDLRVSLTDRCNFRCLYCLPETEAAHNFYRGHWAHLPDSAPIVRQWAPKSHLLTFEELERVVRLAAALGIQKIRLTGGEPLLRQCVEELVARLSGIPGISDLAMTTNGFLFPQKARALRQAGLQRVSFSLDSLDRDNFKKITGRGEIGIIAPVSEPFCGHCNRIRLTADGKIRTCLFSVTEHDLRSLLRSGHSDEQIADWLHAVVWQKEARHHIGEPDFVAPPR